MSPGQALGWGAVRGLSRPGGVSGAALGRGGALSAAGSTHDLRQREAPPTPVRLRD